MRNARAAAVVAWVYVTAFGLPVIPVVVILRQRRVLPTLFGPFQVYGGPWSSRLDTDALIWLLVLFLALCLLVAWTALLVWKGSRPLVAVLPVGILRNLVRGTALSG